MELKLDWDELASLSQVIAIAERSHLSIKIDGDNGTVTVRREGKT